MMNLGDVAEKSVPKMTIISAPRAGGAIVRRMTIAAPTPLADGLRAFMTSGDVSPEWLARRYYGGHGTHPASNDHADQKTR